MTKGETIAHDTIKPHHYIYFKYMSISNYDKTEMISRKITKDIISQEGLGC